MKLLRKGFALVMAMLIVSSVFTVMPLTTSAATSNNVSVSASSTKSGKCGKNVNGLTRTMFLLFTVGVR